jgi:hypothetical protein
MPGLTWVSEEPERDGSVTKAIRPAHDASRFSQVGTCTDVARAAVKNRQRALKRTGFLVDSGSARLVDVVRTPKESAFQTA